MMTEFANKDAIVFDLRNYPNGTLWTLVDYLYPGSVVPAKIVAPNLEYPTGFYAYDANIGNGTGSPYAGRVIILMNEETQSQAEYTVMGLEQHPNAVKIGSQTAGADGDVTAAYLPGKIIAFFTGKGVYYPDKKPTQRVGIVPDLFIRPSIQGVRAGTDEVLAKALDCENIENITWPKAVQPQTGLYWDPQKDGKGFDIHQVGDDYIVFAYDFRADGSPVWYLGTAMHDQGVLQAPENSMAEYSHNSDSSVINYQNQPFNLNIDFQAGCLQPACAVSSPENKFFPAMLTWQFAAETETRCMEALMFSGAVPENNMTGLWDGGAEDNGWGLSVNHQGNTLVVLLYYYDDSGAASWLIGSTEYSDSQSVTMDLLPVSGYCQTCSAAPVIYTHKGKLTLSLSEADTEFNLGNWVSLNLTEASLWDREKMPIKMITQPIEN